MQEREANAAPGSPTADERAVDVVDRLPVGRVQCADLKVCERLTVGAIRAAERAMQERCAKVADDYEPSDEAYLETDHLEMSAWDRAAQDIASAIRALPATDLPSPPTAR